ncbi:MAG: DUF1800 domain-containing protein [Armatimonadetes bacterium]|nr:DUF1800 domain-containing protein [Armatimonadota bacterium]
MDATRQQIAHLMRRAGFSCSAAELDRRAALGLDATLSELLHYESQPDLPPLFDPASRTPATTPPLTMGDIQSFWIHRMIKSPRQLQEKMALFWHGHFATAQSKVNNTGYMLRQYLFFRDHALSDFRTILQGISRDPAMLVWLDNIYNTKKSPNENYAREVMELFSLGIGNYTEQDIRQAARAFSGWQVKNGEFWINIRDHDFSTKTVFGVSGRLNGDDIVDLLIAHPATAQFMARKLLRFFASENPAPEWVNRIAGVFRQTNGSIRSTVEAIFRSPEFYAADTRNRTHKSPAEFAIGAVRELESSASHSEVRRHLRLMGQDLFNPPTVKGWDGGPSWMNTSTVLARINFAGYVTGVKAGKLAATQLYQTLLNSGVKTPADAIGYFEERLNSLSVAAETRTVLTRYLNSTSSGVTGPFRLTQASADVKVRNMVRLLVSSPEYQFNMECAAPLPQPAPADSSPEAAPHTPRPGRRLYG